MTTQAVERLDPLAVHELEGVNFAGVDTHSDTHTVAVIDPMGRTLATAMFPADEDGYAQLHTWLGEHGPIGAVGIEGTGSYGAALSVYLLEHSDYPLIEVNRPNRAARRARGKSDDLDAINAARSVANGQATTPLKERTGRIEALRVMHVTRRASVDDRSDAMRELKSMIITAPAALRAQLKDLTNAVLIRTCANMQPGADFTDATTATQISMRALARRWQHHTTVIAELEPKIKTLVKQLNPTLLKVYGIGQTVAAQILVTAGGNPERLRNEAAFAMLCGAAPLPASSGRTTRHRLNRGGDRQANRALTTILTTRLRRDPRTRAYVERRTHEGRTQLEINRCLKRFIAREVYHYLNPTTP